MIPFDFQGNGIRVLIDEKGDPWWIGHEVCGVLGYADASDAIRRHCKYAKKFNSGVSPELGLTLTHSPNGILVIPESDLYCLILGSHMPKAEEFKKWVTEEVLPAIRKTEMYEIGPLQASRQLERYLLSSGHLGILEVKLPCQASSMPRSCARIRQTKLDSFRSLSAHRRLRGP